MTSRVRVAASVLIVVAIVAALLAVQRVLPSSSDQAGADYYTLSGAGIDLGPASGSAAELGQLAPDFTLLNLDGAPVSLSSLRGQTVLINFWASWCVPCRREMPEIEEAFLERRDAGLTVLAVNLKEGRDQAKAFADNYGLTFTVLLDSKGEVARVFRLTGLPESWIVSADGVLRERKIGAFRQGELEQVLDAVMDRPLAEQD